MLIALIVASYYDAKKWEIPLWVFPIASVLYLFLRFKEINWFISITGACIGIIAFTIMALKYNGGGGDILMMGSVGLILGAQNLLYITCIASALCLVYYIARRVKTVPYAPFVLIAYIINFVWGYLNGIYSNWDLAWHYILL